MVIVDRMSRLLIVGLLVATALGCSARAASAAAPRIAETWVTEVTSSSANLRAKIDPEGISTTYRFEYLTEAAYEANLNAAPPRDPFFGASSAPPSGAAPLGAGTIELSVVQHVGSLSPTSAYRFRVVATSSGPSGGRAEGPAHFFATEAPTNVVLPADSRAFELVSPADKGGGAIAAPETLFGGGEFQAAAAGDAITYSSSTAFGSPSSGAPPGSQYISHRGSAGWSTENASVPLESGGYGDQPDGVPFRVFSEDLARALVLDPRRCNSGEACPRGYSLRTSATGALVPLPAAAAGMRVLSASPDLGRIVFDDAGEAFEWRGGGLVSTSLLPPTAGPGAVFQAAADSRFSFYTEAGHLYRYDATGGTATDLTPAGGVAGVLGISPDGSTVYFQDTAALKRWRSGGTVQVAAGADATLPGDYLTVNGTARVTADGLHVAFLSDASLGGFDNADAGTAEPDTELYLYGPPPGGGTAELNCASCNATGERPDGSASIPGILQNGSTRVYKPRVLSQSGNRVFFESSDDLALNDTNSRIDVYEWEAAGEGDCTRSPGCQSLISGGREHVAVLLDASATGDDVYFLTEDSLVPSDPGSIDVYDARAGGGFVEPPKPLACVADACQPLPSPPEDPSPGTLVPNSGNPPLKYYSPPAKKHKHKKHHHHHGKHRPKHGHGKGQR